MDNDISILWVNGNIPQTATSRPALIAGPNYYPADNQVVWAAGWGHTIVSFIFKIAQWSNKVKEEFLV